MITDLEPDIQECEVKWTLESITTNKASGGDGIPVELFHILKTTEPALQSPSFETREAAIRKSLCTTPREQPHLPYLEKVPAAATKTHIAKNK